MLQITYMQRKLLTSDQAEAMIDKFCQQTAGQLNYQESSHACHCVLCFGSGMHKYIHLIACIKWLPFTHVTA